MTIHSSHPFADPEPERDPVRRLRGRVGGVVSLWATGQGRDRVGLTVSSFMVGHGDPAHLLALVDPESDLASRLEGAGGGVPLVVQLLSWSHRDLSDAFAGTAPAPGGPFTTGEWVETSWGPVLTDTSAWAGVRLTECREVGWSLLLDATVEHVEIAEDADPLVHRRGRYLRP